MGQPKKSHAFPKKLALTSFTESHPRALGGSAEAIFFPGVPELRDAAINRAAQLLATRSRVTACTTTEQDKGCEGGILQHRLRLWRQCNEV